MSQSCPNSKKYNLAPLLIPNYLDTLKFEFLANSNPSRGDDTTRDEMFLKNIRYLLILYISNFINLFYWYFYNFVYIWESCFGCIGWFYWECKRTELFFYRMEVVWLLSEGIILNKLMRWSIVWLLVMNRMQTWMNIKMYMLFLFVGKLLLAILNV